MPFDPGSSGWKGILPPGPSYPNLQVNQSADFAIVGAGFAGLSAARRLRQLNPDSAVAVLEARNIADGPAGRNSGFMIDIPHHLGSRDYSGMAEADRKQVALNREAIAFAADAVKEYSMPDEAFTQSGKINAAATRAGIRRNLGFAAHLDLLGEPYELLDEKAMHRISGSRYYLGGLRTPGAAMIQPALYVRELAHGVSRNNVELFENSPIVKFERVGGRWNLATPEGSLSATKVIIAVNGHVESFGYFRKRLMHIYLYASMTRQLDENEIGALGGMRRWGFTPANPLGTTVRRTSGIGGDRIVVRNRFTWAPKRTVSASKPESMAAVHDRSFRSRFPNLADVEMEYRWGGLLCMSRNSAPAFGELEPNLYSACCQNGLGIAYGTLSGKLAAELASEQVSPSVEIMLGQPRPRRMPPEPLSSIGANVIMGWGEIKAGKER